MFVSFRHTVPLVLCASVALGACSRQNPPKIPLGGAAAATAHDPAKPLPPAAREALDKGNQSFRAGNYQEALAFYREASKAAPNEAAPYFGVLMVAQKLGNQSLADSANRAIAERNGAQQMLSDNSIQDLHQGGAYPTDTGAGSTKAKK